MYMISLFTLFIVFCEYLDSMIIFVIDSVFNKRSRQMHLLDEICVVREELESADVEYESEEFEELENKLDLLIDEYKEEDKYVGTLYASIRCVFGYSAQLLCNSICSFIILTNFRAPFLEVDAKWLSPLVPFLCFPETVKGNIGILPWFLIVKNAIAAFRRF